MIPPLTVALSIIVGTNGHPLAGLALFACAFLLVMVDKRYKP